MRKLLFAGLLVCCPLAAQEIPRATALPGDPFFIKKTWVIGGGANWDSLTIDSKAQRLYIAHGSVVEVVDIDSGERIGQIAGFREAHTVALDDTGAFAYVSDGKADAVVIVDMRRLDIDSTIPIYCSPRSVAFEPASRLVFAICGASAAAPAASRQPVRLRAGGSSRPAHPVDEQAQADLSGISHIVAIDTDSKAPIADIAIAGDFRFAQPDGDGQVYISVGGAHRTWLENGRVAREDFPQRIARLDGPAIVTNVHRQLDAQSRAITPAKDPVHLDWNHNANPGSGLDFIRLSANCANPQGLAVDHKHVRLFLACDDQRLLVLNAGTGESIASLTTGPGDDVIGYDRERGLVFVANGSGYGSLTIIQQDGNTDSYEVIQNLPTRERARTLAVDSSTGEVYLVTDYYGVDLTKPGGIGTMTDTPILGSFHVLVVGH